MSRIDDSGFVREQYATEANLAARKAAYATREGPDAREALFDAVAEARPRRVLEVGGGEGELAERLVRDLGVELVGVDQSERMVAIQRERGLDARVGNVEQLPCENGSFDVAVAAWMLYHVPDVDRGLAELARVLVSGGRLVAVVNGYDHLAELWDLLGRDRSYRRRVIGRESGEEMLARHYASVDRRDCDGWITMDEKTVRAYVASWADLGDPEDVPHLVEPLRVRTTPTMFVATTA